MKEDTKMAVKLGDTNSNVMGQSPVIVDANDTGVISLAKVEETRQTYDLTTMQDKFKQEIIASGEVDKLTSLIDISNTNSIVEFGKAPAVDMSKVADQILSKYDTTVMESTSKMIDKLLKVMKKIDLDEIQNVKELMAQRQRKSFLDKFRESAEEKLNKLVGKYRGIGAELEEIVTELCTYEDKIKSTNEDISKMYDQAKDSYRVLMGYILAGDQAVDEITEYRDQKQQEAESTGNSDIKFEVQNLNQALTLMEQRVADLRGAQAVALQSVPTFKIQEYTNSNLQRKINSAFIVTIPAFKTALVNSVIAKQQALQAQGLAALDEATSMLIRKNADNAVAQLQQSQKLANSSAIKADDIEYAWGVIMNGIKEYKDMEENYRQIRKEESRRIEAANAQYLQSLSEGSSL